MIIVSKYLVPKGYSGLVVFPFIFLKYKRLKTNSVLLNHEKIHLRQQLELLILPFFIIYGIEFFVHWLRLKNWSKAYRAISFEREAYTNEKDMGFLKQRPFWNFVKYLKR